MSTILRTVAPPIAIDTSTGLKHSKFGEYEKVVACKIVELSNLVYSWSPISHKTLEEELEKGEKGHAQIDRALWNLKTVRALTYQDDAWEITDVFIEMVGPAHIIKEEIRPHGIKELQKAVEKFSNILAHPNPRSERWLPDLETTIHNTNTKLERYGLPKLT